MCSNLLHVDSGSLDLSQNEKKIKVYIRDTPFIQIVVYLVEICFILSNTKLMTKSTGSLGLHYYYVLEKHSLEIAQIEVNVTYCGVILLKIALNEVSTM